MIPETQSDTARPGTPLRLRMFQVGKRFGATHALKNVSLEVRPGETHALIGENGAGKSTLMKILSGACLPDSGEIELDGHKFVPRDPLHARRCGIAMIYQELNLAPDLTVEENILLGGEPARWGWVNRRQQRRLAQECLAELHHDTIPLDAPVKSRSLAEQQIVEIARALRGQPKVLIMDEPTSSLSGVDTENLFAVIDRLRRRGVSIVYISHFLEECKRVCDRFTVLRDGETAGTGAMRDADLNRIIELMVGRRIQEVYPRTPRTLGDPVLELRSVSGRSKPRTVSLTLRAGEIFGLAGLMGAGRTETLRVCFGLDRLEAGSVVVAGHASNRGSPAFRLRQGLGFLSESRKDEGLMLNRSLADNLTLSCHRGIARAGWIWPQAQRQVAETWMGRLKVRAEHPGQRMFELSGGNQQKIALGRLLHQDAKVLLLDEPTRGIDVASKVQIYEWMNRLAEQRKAIIFVSSYLPELLGICDTIGVMCRGQLAEVRPVAEWTEHSIIATAVGQTLSSEPRGSAA
jgi:ribose transport system ATP-binding protein